MAHIFHKYNLDLQQLLYDHFLIAPLQNIGYTNKTVHPLQYKTQEILAIFLYLNIYNRAFI